MIDKLKLEKLSMEIRLFETLEENKLISKNPNIKYMDMLRIINNKVKKKYGKKQEKLFNSIFRYID